VSRGTWRLRAPILGLGVALVIAGCADSATRAPAASPARTPTPVAQAKVFVPVSTSPGRTLHGTCWTSSITVHSSAAYRCYAGNTILDPCFAATRSARVVTCYADPWSPGTSVLLTAALPKPAPLPVTHPWALELANGKRCVAATGVVNRVAGVPLLYHCQHGGAAGLPVTRDGHTEVRYVAPGSRTAVPVAVSVTWQA
jgi:hypothetical protein